MAAGEGDSFPSFLPDGRRFLYRVFNEANPSISIATLDSKEGKRIGPGSSALFVPPSWLLYVRSTTLVAQSFDPDKATLSGDAIPIAEQVAVVASGGPSGGAPGGATLTPVWGRPAASYPETCPPHPRGPPIHIATDHWRGRERRALGKRTGLGCFGCNPLCIRMLRCR